jgi:molybdenum cofactor biosynthesis protein B
MSNQHRKQAPRSVSIAIVSVSSTRSLSNDHSGHWMVEQARLKGHPVNFHQVIDDDAELIGRTVQTLVSNDRIQAIILTGGTGISSRDVTIEAVKPMLTKELVAFTTLFSHLSYAEVDSAAIMSRATAGIIVDTIVFCLPGSLKACQLACEKLIFPELGHLVHHVQKG